MYCFQRLVGAALIVYVAAGLASCGGGGGSDSNSPTGSTVTVAAQSATVTFDSSVPSSVQAAIASIVSPLDSQAQGAQLFVPISSSAGESMVLATDSNDNIMLASLSTSTSVSLSVDSTALALTRILLGVLPDTASPIQVNAAIRATAEYPNLVSLVSSTLAANTSPATSLQVFTSLTTVISQLPTAVLATAAQATRPTAFAQSAPVAQPSVSVPLPSNLFTTSAFGHNTGAVSITGVAPAGGAQVSNTTAIAWSLASSTTSGASLCTAGTSPTTLNPDCSITIPAGGLIQQLKGTPNNATIAGNGDAFNVTLEQNTTSRTANILQIGQDLIKVSMALLN